MLGSITTILGGMDLNITQQLNTSRGGIAYNVIDIEELPEDPRTLQLTLAEQPGILSSRMIVGLPGFGFHSSAFGNDSYHFYDQ